LGCYKTEIEAAKFVNFVCVKNDMELKNPELSDEETETFTWPLFPRKVASFLYIVNLLFTLDASYLIFPPSPGRKGRVSHRTTLQPPPSIFHPTIVEYLIFCDQPIQGLSIDKCLLDEDYFMSYESQISDTFFQMFSNRSSFLKSEIV
jgi:hypothetical protein